MLTPCITGMYEMIGGWRLKDTYIEGIRKVTPEEVSGGGAQISDSGKQDKPDTWSRRRRASKMKKK